MKAATWPDGARNTADSGVTPLSNKPKCGPVREREPRPHGRHHIRIGNEDPDRLITYPDAHNLSRCAQPIPIGPEGQGPGKQMLHPRQQKGMAGQHASRTTPHQRGGRRRTAKPPPNVACNSIGRRFNQVRKRCNSNAANSGFEMVTRELHAKLVECPAIKACEGCR